MTDEIFDADNPMDMGDTSGNPLPKHLRDMYEKEKERRVALEKQVAGLNSQFRGSELKRVFIQKGIPEKAVALFPQDVDVDDESVNKWVEEYGSLFGAVKPVETPNGVTPTTDTQSTATAPQNASQGQAEGIAQMAQTLNQMNNVVSSGTPANGTHDYDKIIFNPDFNDIVPESDFREWLRSKGAKL